MEKPIHHDPDYMEIYTIATYLFPSPSTNWQLPGMVLMIGDTILQKISIGGESSSGKELVFVFYICLTSDYF